MTKIIAYNLIELEILYKKYINKFFHKSNSSIDIYIKSRRIKNKIFEFEFKSK